MPEHYHYNEGDIVNPETRHEESDVNVRALLWFVAIFIAFAIVTHVVLYALYSGFIKFEKHRQAALPPLTAMQRPDSMNVPPAPRLQPFRTKDAQGVDIAPYNNTPVTDLVEMRAGEDRVLNHYGYVDAQHGVVHIPIDEAKQLALQRNLFPTMPGSTEAVDLAPAATSAPTVVTEGDANAAKLPSSATTATSSAAATTTSATAPTATAPSTTSTTGTQPPRTHP